MEAFKSPPNLYINNDTSLSCIGTYSIHVTQRNKIYQLKIFLPTFQIHSDFLSENSACPSFRILIELNNIPVHT